MGQCGRRRDARPDVETPDQTPDGRAEHVCPQRMGSEIELGRAAGQGAGRSREEQGSSPQLASAVTLSYHRPVVWGGSVGQGQMGMS